MNVKEQSGDLGQLEGPSLSPIATRKLVELAAQGYAINGVAIFNPATGQRGLVDNLGYVGWLCAPTISTVTPPRDLRTKLGEVQ